MFASPLLLIAGFLISLSVHEAFHAYMADRLGDPTARLSGRVTLNPLAHLDPLGTLIPLFLLFTGSPIVFGWGKPVPFDPFNLKNPRRDAALISFAGPAANLALATVLSLFLRLAHLALPAGLLFGSLLAPIIALNIMWALFNLIPIHPLDGGKVLIGLLPQDLAYEWDKILSQYGFVILLFLIFPFFGRSLVISFISPIVNLLLRILLPSTPLI